MPSLLSGLIALAVMLPVVALLALAAHYLDDEGEPSAMPPRHPARNTWTVDEVET